MMQHGPRRFLPRRPWWRAWLIALRPDKYEMCFVVGMTMSPVGVLLMPSLSLAFTWGVLTACVFVAVRRWWPW